MLGTGGSYGECIILNMCENEWAVIDCCTNPYTREVLPLKFLQDHKISPEKVKFIVCTHWHDDHIDGISDVFEYASKADFIFTRVNDAKKFLQLVSLDHNKSEYPATKKSTKEFMKCFEIMKSRDIIYKDAGIDRLLYTNKLSSSNTVQVISLSPSDKSAKEFDEHISYMMNEYMDTNKSIPEVNPNHRSVVLLLKLGKHNVLLGSDLEVTSDELTGWTNIINNSTHFNMISDANYFKIPHHGSENGYVAYLWNNLFGEDSVGTITPWKNGLNYLPKDRLLTLYKSKTSELFLTNSHKQSKKPKKRDREIAKIINRSNPDLSEYKYNFGIIKSSIDVDKKDSVWLTELFGTAIQY